MILSAKNIIYLLLCLGIISTQGCVDKETELLAVKVCQCFTQQAASFASVKKASKERIIRDCYQAKIEAVARDKNEEYLKTYDKSNLFEFMFQTTANTAARLDRSCDFFQENREELLEIIRDADWEFD